MVEYLKTKDLDYPIVCTDFKIRKSRIEGEMITYFVDDRILKEESIGIGFFIEPSVYRKYVIAFHVNNDKNDIKILDDYLKIVLGDS